MYSNIVNFSSIQDDTLPDQLTDDIDQPTYSVVDGASQRGKRKLVDVDGYTYTVKISKGRFYSKYSVVKLCKIIKIDKYI